MANTPEHNFTRRALLSALALAPAATLLGGEALAQTRPKIITMLGDSITAGFGLPSRDSLPVRLEAEINRLGGRVRIRGAGVSGDTSAAGLSRVNFSVQADTDLCLVALGGNDLLQGLDPVRTRRNLDAIITRLQTRKIRVALAGMRPPPALGRSYARDFSAIFPALASKHKVTLYPDLLAGVAGLPALNQRDGIHPNAEGVKIIARKMAPTVLRALR
jgi:acyl-CoA thioesterase I